MLPLKKKWNKKSIKPQQNILIQKYVQSKLLTPTVNSALHVKLQTISLIIKKDNVLDVKKEPFIKMDLVWKNKK